ncbi:hypothetical protein XENTR_v10004114 [Xenopus tropicalis]|nr:hypothetical protein XENTR_v10004114 [Xenopus tropicalis]
MASGRVEQPGNCNGNLGLRAPAAQNSLSWCNNHPHSLLQETRTALFPRSQKKSPMCRSVFAKYPGNGMKLKNTEQKNIKFSM